MGGRVQSYWYPPAGSLVQLHLPLAEPNFPDQASIAQNKFYGRKRPRRVPVPSFDPAGGQLPGDFLIARGFIQVRLYDELDDFGLNRIRSEILTTIAVIDAIPIRRGSACPTPLIKPFVKTVGDTLAQLFGEILADYEMDAPGQGVFAFGTRYDLDPHILKIRCDAVSVCGSADPIVTVNNQSAEFFAFSRLKHLIELVPVHRAARDSSVDEFQRSTTGNFSAGVQLHLNRSSVILRMR